jgi:hypothetical protein
MKRAAALLLSGLLLLGATSAAVAQRSTDPSVIGTATMASDGTIKLDLYGDDEAADTHLEYRTTSNDYKTVLAYFGSFTAGETKPVKTWPPPDNNAH